MTQRSDSDNEATVELDTTALRNTQKKPSLESTSPGNDPYGTADDRVTVQRKPRRTLDDMRQLSESIKRARAPSDSPAPEGAAGSKKKKED
jgi:hypothetical protein